MISVPREYSGVRINFIWIRPRNAIIRTQVNYLSKSLTRRRKHNSCMFHHMFERTFSRFLFWRNWRHSILFNHMKTQLRWSWTHWLLSSHHPSSRCFAVYNTSISAPCVMPSTDSLNLPTNKMPTSSSGTAFYKTNRNESILRSRSCWAFSHRSDPSLSQSSSALNLSQNSATQVNSKINFRFMSRVNSISFEYPVTLHSRFKKIHGFSITSGSRKSPELSQFLK